MPATDRRSGQERRAAQRFKIAVDVDWENFSGRRTGTLSDISRSGCFVLTSGEFVDNEIVKVFIPAGDGIKIEFIGHVSNHAFEIGFALRFKDVSKAHIAFVEQFVADNL